MGVLKFLPQERVSSIVVQIVVCHCHRLCRKRGGDTARLERSNGADCVPQIMEEITESSAGTLAPMILLMSPR